jgi:glycosyltransferase involved in cell wall biosynthesis
MKKRLHWVCQSPSPYNDFLFSNLRKAPEFDLLVHYVCPESKAHPWRLSPPDYASRVLDTRFGLDKELLRSAIVETNSFFILAGWNRATHQAIATYLSLAGGRFAIWTDSPNALRRRGYLKHKLRRAWLQWIFGSSEAVMGTGVMALDALATLGCPKQKLVNLPYIVDTLPFSYDNAPRTSVGSPVFISSGRLVNAHKGYDLALAALARAKGAGLLPDFRYRIAGSGPDDGALRQLARDLRIDQHVEFVGWVQPADLPSFYRSGEFFLHPARFEPYGVVIIEALASGLVVIGSNRTGAIVDRVIDRESGYIHQSGSVQDLTKAIVDAVSAKRQGRFDATLAQASAAAWSAEKAVGVIRNVVLHRQHRLAE